MLLSAESLLIIRSVSIAKVIEGCHMEEKPGYRGEFSIRGMFKEYARLAWRRYLVDETDTATIPTVKKHDALTKAAGSIVCAAVADVKV